ncbi:hypothetical protein CPB85DRAFT_108581 [Mucidula mucida]|nr:hypothetical protein CPB85DRAFT_108581 [Mucidula mucida]
MSSPPCNPRPTYLPQVRARSALGNTPSHLSYIGSDGVALGLHLPSIMKDTRARKHRDRFTPYPSPSTSPYAPATPQPRSHRKRSVAPTPPLTPIIIHTPTPMRASPIELDVPAPHTPPPHPHARTLSAPTVAPAPVCRSRPLKLPSRRLEFGSGDDEGCARGLGIGLGAPFVLGTR